MNDIVFEQISSENQESKKKEQAAMLEIKMLNKK